MVAEMELEPSQVQKFYEGGKIFITGGSGFLGNLLLQKLLRDCSNISKIYLLLRPKKEKSPEQRLNEMFQDLVFENLKKEQPNFMDKIEIITGDIEQSNLGINENDKKMLEQEVNIIFHVAATIRFTEKLRKAVTSNVCATWDLVKLAKNMPNLKVFLHVSTAYSFCPRKSIKEVIYDTPVSPERIIQIIDTLNDDELTTLTPNLLGVWPNTYTFTKALGEKVLQEQGEGLPLVIVRPSMVISSYKDPLEGWINNIYGPVGVAFASGIGLLRVSCSDLDNIADMIPGDIIVNNMIVAASYVGSKLNGNKKENVQFDEISNISNVPVFNCTSGAENPLTWGMYNSFGYELCSKWMTIHSVWYFFVVSTPNHYLSKVLQFVLETIPAYMMDFVLYCLGKKPRLVKINKKIQEFGEVIRYFAIREWNFNNSNTQALWKCTNQTDRKLFPFSIKEVNWREYFEIFGKGLRVYLIKDPLETLPEAQAKYRKLKFAHYILVTIFWFICAYVLYKFLFLFL